MKILGIETSCDETGIAYVHIHNRTKKVRLLSENLLSQIDIHKEYGGVLEDCPEMLNFKKKESNITTIRTPILFPL